MTFPAMSERVRFSPNLPWYQDGRYIHLILDGQATQRCDVLVLADELRICLHFIR
jgi:hypothetical protein